MSTVHHYRSNLRDVFFNLFEFLEVGQRVLGREPYASLDEETARETLKQFERVCSQDLAAAFAASDRDPPKLGPDGEAILPESLKRAMQSYYDGGWHLFEIPTHLGGVGAPPSLVWASFEICLLYTSPSPRDRTRSRMPSSA